MSPAGAAIGAALLPSLLLAAGAGLLSFLSPCVLPLVPAWLSYISGYGLKDGIDARARGRILVRTLAFSAGFTLVFVVLGLAFAGGAQAIGGGGARTALRLLSGLVVILLGANLVFDFARFLNYEKRFHPARPSKGGLAGIWGALLLGFAFAAGWSPCVGPILASILLLASDVAVGTGGPGGGLARAAALLAAYSLGLALPFLATGLAAGRLGPFLERAKRKGKAIRIGSGLLLIVLGALMASGRLGSVSGAAARSGYALLAALDTAPAIPLAVDLAVELALVLALLLPPLARRPAEVGKRTDRPGHAGPSGAAGRGKRHIIRIVISSAIVLAAAAEVAGLWSLARAVAGWLTFQGA